ncbi:DUF805 domain-containing protein [Staphylococcus sp. 18_1_E_LY]|uniref:DUF805 domain-containing protein n=1 Tax=Staphylococcus lloydii TaxID=2781774 RepID=A0A7T1AZG5_9STAP|nr:DUF805 domain-containing protein [Staphylococcus lloydii]MBF7019579.1 DUF805 domain-containing protein [Staphylococcus lloydii]MBF7027306.1 DUF805 domain-containing protein [Staphylococcus lloydii]QPM74974.1 DUF805 domain-containing protein [Staphylococcus lloydii]
MLHYYKLYWLNALKIHGRARRKEFWYPILATLIIEIVASILNSVLPLPSWLTYTIATVFSIVNLVPSFTVTVRRFHDLDMTMKIPVILFVFSILADINDLIPSINIDFTFNNVINIIIAVIFIVIVAAFLILGIISLAVCCTRGNEQSNKYGINPKYVN